jgi:hypothetical protein
MAMVKVYRVDFYDIQNDGMVRSRRWFTRKGAERAGGTLVEGTEVEIDDAHLEAGLWTQRDYNPHSIGGLQRQVVV